MRRRKELCGIICCTQRMQDKQSRLAMLGFALQVKPGSGWRRCKL